MIEIGIGSLEKSFGTDKIFENVTFDIKTKEKIGLVGRNGVGKTTLMKIIYGIEQPTNGQVNKRRGLKVGYLEQIHNFDKELSVYDVLQMSFADINKLKKDMDELHDTFDSLSGTELDNAVKRYSSLQESFEALGGYNVKEKLGRIVKGLNLSDDMLKRKFDLLSGGEKTRVVLGKILLESPEILLLDEPSNHLDIKSIEWLEDYLNAYEGTIVMISHDRFFLDRVCNKIVELERDGATTYNGNYSKYVTLKELKFLQAMREYENQQRKIKKMEEQIHRYRVWGASRDSDKMYRRAKELEKRLEKIDKLNKPIKDKKIESFRLNAAERTGKEVIRVSELYKSFGDNKLLRDVSFNVYYKDSFAILGENGTGKSTIIKMIMGELEKDSGEIKIGSKVQIGYLPQDVRFDNEDMQIVDFFSYKYGISLAEARKELAKIIFTEDDVYKKISTLSGGEKSRLKLLTLMYEKSNVLILDEPTNHLDIDSREVLEDDLINYDGTILFVSHDRYFVDKIATRIGEVENHTMKCYDFDYEGYKQEKERVKLLQTEEAVKTTEVKISSNKEDYLKRKEESKRIEKKKRDLEKLEKKIIDTEEQIKNYEEQLNVSSNNIDLKEYNKMFDDYTNLKSELEKMYESLDEMYNDEEIMS